MNPLALALLGVGVFALLSKQSQAAAYYTAPTYEGELIPQPGQYNFDPVASDPSYEYADDTIYVPDNYEIADQYTMTNEPANEPTSEPLDNWDLQGQYIPPPDAGGSVPVSLSSDQAARNVSAYLAVIRMAESNNNYRILYGGDIWQGSMSDHPGNLGWKGKKLPPAQCIAAGIASGTCFSNAAGAYQFISTTWNALKNRLGLPDFSETSQDAAAVELLRESQALQYIAKGNLSMGNMMASVQWASLPGSTAKQGGWSAAQVEKYYTANGGVSLTSSVV